MKKLFGKLLLVFVIGSTLISCEDGKDYQAKDACGKWVVMMSVEGFAGSFNTTADSATMHNDKHVTVWVNGFKTELHGERIGMRFEYCR